MPGGAEGTETDFRLWEITENLHRAELTMQERPGHIVEWVRLTDEKGQRKAARELGIAEPEVRRAAQIAALAPETKQAILITAKPDTARATEITIVVTRFLRLVCYQDMLEALLPSALRNGSPIACSVG